MEKENSYPRTENGVKRLKEDLTKALNTLVMKNSRFQKNYTEATQNEISDIIQRYSSLARHQTDQIKRKAYSFLQHQIGQDRDQDKNFDPALYNDPELIDFVEEWIIRLPQIASNDLLYGTLNPPVLSAKTSTIKTYNISDKAAIQAQKDVTEAFMQALDIKPQNRISFRFNCSQEALQHLMEETAAFKEDKMQTNRNYATMACSYIYNALASGILKGEPDSPVRYKKFQHAVNHYMDGIAKNISTQVKNGNHVPLFPTAE